MADTTGFQTWLAEWRQDLRESVCWFVGHRIVASPWRRSPNTVHTHYRVHECARCGAASYEDGYFDALKRGQGGPADEVPW